MVKILMGITLACFIVITYHNTFFITSPPANKIIKSLGFTSLILGALTWTGILRKLDMAVACLFACSLFITAIHYMTTHKYQYATDVDGHIGYIRSLIKNSSLPYPSGWQSQQPPLYYFVGALFLAAGYAAGLSEPVQAVRFLSFLLYTGFLIVSLLTLRHFFTKRLWLVIASSLVLFWPDGFTYAGRIGNDQGILFVHTLVLYYLIRWNEEKQVKYLLWSIYGAFTALIIKGSGVISIGAVGIVCLAALYHHEVKLRQLLRWRLIAFCIGCVALNFGRTLYYRLAYGMNIKWFINLDLRQIKDGLVGNTPYHYFYFDISGFIHRPFFYSMPKGEPLFWNAFLKMLLLGEWYWQSPVLASMLSALLIFILCYVLYYLLFRITWGTVRPYAPLLAMMFCMIAALMAARIQVPWACQANGRYIYGIVVIFAIFFTKALEAFVHEKRVLPVLFGMVIVLSFCIMSILLILREHPLLFS